MYNKVYERNGLKVTELEAYTSLNSSNLELIKFKVEVDGETRIDTLNRNSFYDKRMINYLSEFKPEERAETYYDMIL